LPKSYKSLNSIKNRIFTILLQKKCSNKILQNHNKCPICKKMLNNLLIRVSSHKIDFINLQRLNNNIHQTVDFIYIPRGVNLAGQQSFFFKLTIRKSGCHKFKNMVVNLFNPNFWTYINRFI
jgi:hypothetical protein